MNTLQKNQIYTTTVEGYSSEGHGVCRIDGRAVFLPRALVGESWRIRLIKVTSTAIYARGEELLSPSPERIDPLCPHFGRCGGCDLCHMSYEEELRFKLDRVNAALTRIGKQTVHAAEILGSDRLTRYRNKGIFAVSEQDGLPCAGFFRERSHDLIPVEHCMLQDELSERVAAAVILFMRRFQIPAYREADGSGAIRHVFCRRSYYGTDAVACIVSASGLGAHTEELVKSLRAACPELSGIVLNINRQRGNTVLAGDFYTLWGRDTMKDSLCGFSYEIAPQAFFQVNPPQAERLYQKALEYASVKANSLALDLYCGAGTISLCLASRAGQVIGAEIVPQAIENAKANAAANGVKNVEFLCADAGQAAQALASRGNKPEVVVVDPPRKGMSGEAITAVASMEPERVVYVSCNPATLARDLLLFGELGYAAQAVTAVDMFPRTAHVETIVLLQRENS